METIRNVKPQLNRTFVTFQSPGAPGCNVINAPHQNFEIFYFFSVTLSCLLGIVHTSRERKMVNQMDISLEAVNLGELFKIDLLCGLMRDCSTITAKRLINYTLKTITCLAWTFISILRYIVYAMMYPFNRHDLWKWGWARCPSCIIDCDLEYNFSVFSDGNQPPLTDEEKKAHKNGNGVYIKKSSKSL